MIEAAFQLNRAAEQSSAGGHLCSLAELVGGVEVLDARARYCSMGAESVMAKRWMIWFEIAQTLSRQYRCIPTVSLTSASCVAYHYSLLRVFSAYISGCRPEQRPRRSIR